MRSRITAASRSGSATRSRCGSTHCPAAAAGGCRAASHLREDTMASPKKLSHLVLQTNRREQMVDWYCTTLGAEVLFQNKHIAFISYDDEHHRVAFIDPGPLADKAPARTVLPSAGADAGMHQVAL